MGHLHQGDILKIEKDLKEISYEKLYSSLCEK